MGFFYQIVGHFAVILILWQLFMVISPNVFRIWINKINKLSKSRALFRDLDISMTFRAFYQNYFGSELKYCLIFWYFKSKCWTLSLDDDTLFAFLIISPNRFLYWIFLSILGTFRNVVSLLGFCRYFYQIFFWSELL